MKCKDKLKLNKRFLVKSFLVKVISFGVQSQFGFETHILCALKPLPTVLFPLVGMYAWVVVFHHYSSIACCHCLMIGKGALGFGTMKVDVAERNVKIS